MDSNIVSGLIGLGGAIIGGVIAGVTSFKSVKKQIDEQNRMVEKRREEEQKMAVNIIKVFLMNEIKRNAEKAILLKSNFTDYEKNDEFNATIILADLSFSEYNEVKYELLKYDPIIVLETITVYQIFGLLDKNKGKSINDLREDEFNFIKNNFRLVESASNQKYKHSYFGEKVQEALENLSKNKK